MLLKGNAFIVLDRDSLLAVQPNLRTTVVRFLNMSHRGFIGTIIRVIRVICLIRDSDKWHMSPRCGVRSVSSDQIALCPLGECRVVFHRRLMGIGGR